MGRNYRWSSMVNKVSISIAFGVIIINGVIGHSLAPFGIVLTPIVVIITSALIAFGTKALKPIWESILIFGLISINDILIKIYAGGTHDNEGQDFVNLSLFVGLVPTFVILSISILRYEQATILQKAIAICLFLTIMVTYLHFSSNLGLGRSY